MFIKVFSQTKILCFRLNFYVFNKCVNKPVQNGYSSREDTMCILVQRGPTTGHQPQILVQRGLTTGQSTTNSIRGPHAASLVNYKQRQPFF